MHATDTLDLMTVLDGRIELDMEDGRVQLAAGDTVVQRGTQHRWRVLDGHPCTYTVVMLRPDAMAPWPAADLAPRPTAAPAGTGPRRIVTGIGPDGRSVIVTDGEAPGTFRFADGAIGYAARWETGGTAGITVAGRRCRPTLDPAPSRRGRHLVQVHRPAALRGDGPPGHERTDHGCRDADPGAGHAHDRPPRPRRPGHPPHRHHRPRGDRRGRGRAPPPTRGPLRLGPGNCIVQRGTWHKWRNVGDTSARFVSVMFGVPVDEAAS